jgi:hypothetical protein
MCSAPVTLGGGMTMTNGGLSDGSSGLKKPDASHQSYHAASTFFVAFFLLMVVVVDDVGVGVGGVD